VRAHEDGIRRLTTDINAPTRESGITAPQETVRDKRTRTLEKLTYTVSETAQALGISRHTVERLIRSGSLPAMRVARRVLVSKAALAHWLEANSTSHLLQRPDAS